VQFGFKRIHSRTDKQAEQGKERKSGASAKKSAAPERAFLFRNCSR
jgi:hypothetical protein